jgi:dihydroneopterin aldolase
MTIFIADLEKPAQIGVHDHERDRTQLLSFDVEIKLTPASKDDIADTLDHESVVLVVERVLNDGHTNRDRQSPRGHLVARHRTLLPTSFSAGQAAYLSARMEISGAIPGVVVCPSSKRAR